MWVVGGGGEQKTEGGVLTRESSLIFGNCGGSEGVARGAGFGG